MDDLRIPWGYDQTYVTLGVARAALLVHYHPEYVRRLCAWLEHKGGTIGVGDRWRATQPAKPGVAPDGKSFHQDQSYNDGFIGACAVDLVAPDGPDANISHDGVTWSMVLPQGSAEAKRWGLHCNVGKPGDPYPQGEPWHIQPIEIDGWQSWVDAGRPAPRANYPLPAPEEPVAVQYFKLPGDPALTVWASSDGLTAIRLEGSVCDARGVDPFKVETLPSGLAARYVYLAGLTSASVK